ncbi:MAG: hypothetical protein P1V20_23570 [Verrucomicrobiales bacterium]|nr:hypothetical protein [Verrucomicrobiales bacterium]
MPRKFLYSITTGRSGTVFLNALLKANIPNATVYHERVGFPHFGVTCPDASHSCGFNTVGNIAPVQQFWKRKLELDAECPSEYFVEISHFLAKAGLVENLGFLPEESEIHLVALKRDPFKIYWSYINRFDFFNSGFTWLFSLDSRYRNVIIDSTPFRKEGMFGNALWYVWEVFARMEYYRLLTENVPNIIFHQVSLENLVTPQGAAKFITSFLGEPPQQIQIPGKQNATKQEFFGDREKEAAKQLMKTLHCDPAALGAEFFHSGRRLGTPTHLKNQ